MIYSEFLREKVIEYCKIRGIRLAGEAVPEEYREEIRNYVGYLNRKGRLETKRKEQSDAMSIKPCIDAVLGVPSKFESPIEEFMHNGLVANGLDKGCVTQHQVGRYRADLAYPDHMVIVECDGNAYHFTEKSQIERDQKRDRYLAKKGWMVVHIDGLSIRRNISKCVELVREVLEMNGYKIDCNCK